MFQKINLLNKLKMEIPNYIYPKYYSYDFNDKNININLDINVSDIKLYKNIKFSKGFKKIEETHNNSQLESEKYWDEKESKLTKEQLIREENSKLFNFIDFFKKNNYMNKKYNLNFYFTNAFRKMYETCTVTPFINKKLKTVRHFDICGLPGGFVFGINHYLKTRNPKVNYDWYLQSYKKDKKGDSYFIDEFGLVKKNPDRILLGDGTGDITKKNNIKEYYNFFEKNKVDIVTSDCGLGFAEIWKNRSGSYKREKQMAKIFYSQMICGLGVLKKGGNYFMKSYHSFSPFSISLFYLLCVYFESVELIKPESSRQPKGKEIYLLCLNLKREITSKEKEKFLDILDNFTEDDMDKNVTSYTKMNKKVVLNIQEKLAEYYNEKIETREKVTEFTYKLIGVDLTENPKNFFMIKDLLEQETQEMMRKYYEDYFKRYKYKRIDNSDKLV